MGGSSTAVEAGSWSRNVMGIEVCDERPFLPHRDSGETMGMESERFTARHVPHVNHGVISVSSPAKPSAKFSVPRTIE
jgi:hypothetical protein